MKIYTETYEQALKKAKKLSNTHGRYYAARSSVLCPHGRSKCCVVFSKQHKIIHRIIVCDKCLAISKGKETPSLSLI